MTRVNEGLHSCTCHPHVYPRMKWAVLPLPVPQLLIQTWWCYFSRWRRYCNVSVLKYWLMIQGHCLVKGPDWPLHRRRRRRDPATTPPVPRRRLCQPVVCRRRRRGAETRPGSDGDMCSCRWPPSSPRSRRDRPPRRGRRRRSRRGGAAGCRGAPGATAARRRSTRDGSDAAGWRTTASVAARRTRSRAAVRTASSPSRGRVRWAFSRSSGTAVWARTAATSSARRRRPHHTYDAAPTSHRPTASYTTYNQCFDPETKVSELECTRVHLAKVSVLVLRPWWHLGLDTIVPRPRFQARDLIAILFIMWYWDLGISHAFKESVDYWIFGTIQQ